VIANNPLDIKKKYGDAPDFELKRVSVSHSNTRVWLMLSSPNACLIISEVSFALFPRFAQIVCTLAVRSIAKSHQARYTTPNKRTQNISTSIQLREILYADSQDMLVALLCAVALRYYTCCIDGDTNPGNYGYLFV
jgi:hypothetical protein